MRDVAGLTRRSSAPCGDLAGGDGDPVERAQAEPYDEESRCAEREQHAGDHEPLDEQQTAQRLVDLAQGHCDERQARILRIVARVGPVAEA